MKSKVSSSKFGTLSDGTKAHIFKVVRENISFCASDFGCTLTCLNVRKPDGTFTDILLGFDTLTSYSTTWGSFGAIIGRFANRISNAKFTLDKKTYNLYPNIETCTLHGGNPAWGNILWKAKKVENKDSCGVVFSRDFEDGYQGFPGNLHVEIEYLIDDENQLKMTYTATSDKPTPVSITNHAYFNLEGKGRIDDYKLKMNCKKFIEVDENNIPTGNILPVKDTVNDFTRTRKIKLANMEKPAYDLCFVTPAFDKNKGIPLEGKEVVKVAELTAPESKIKMEVFTNQEGIQLYTARYLNMEPGKGGIQYHSYMAVCLETQSFPDSPNQKNFPPAILNPGETYKAVTIYKFS